MLFTIEDDDDLFLYEEDDFDDKAIDLAFGDNEMIEALIIVLSHLFSRSLKLFFLCLLFLSLFCLFDSLRGLDFVLCMGCFLINPEKKEMTKQQKKQNKKKEELSSYGGTFWSKIRQTLSFFF